MKKQTARTLLTTVFLLLNFLNSLSVKSQNLSLVKYYQSKEINPITNIVGDGEEVFLLSKTSENKINLVKINLSDYNPQFFPINSNMIGENQRNLKLYLDTGSNFILYNKQSNELFLIRNIIGKYNIDKITINNNIRSIIEKKPFDNFDLTEDSFYFFYTHSPFNFNENFSEILAISRKTGEIKLNRIIKDIDGSFCSLYQPFNLVAINKNYYVRPKDNVMNFEIIKISNERVKSISLNNTDFNSIDLINKINLIKKMYFLTEEGQYLDSLDIVNSKISRICNLILKNNFLIVHYQNPNKENRIIPDYYFDVYQIEDSNDDIKLEKVINGQKDFVHYDLNYVIDHKKDMLFTNLTVSNLDFVISNKTIIISDLIIENPTENKTIDENLKDLKNKKKVEVFTLAIYKF